ncbi:MAG TPA: carboxypeptidase regulatory-like domain-containing protein [Verrucomicrobiae bacterium]|nr:carboxypeptidase regulatory-like domain-containing protein [Verrucomicrobiae bacterium]
MKLSSIALLMATLAASPVLRAADIIGVITLKGTPPPEKEITPLEDDPTCGPLHKDKPMTQFYVVGKNGEFADVVVSLKGVGKSTGANQPPAVLDQKGCLYVPTILAVQTGQKIVVKNSDPCIHNVHSTPTVAGNDEHNDAQMPGGPDLTYTFPQPEMFLRFKCDVHPWMFAWVSVMDSPYYSVSDKDGKFVIKNVPPGKYMIEAAHRKAGEKTQEVEVADKDVTVNFTFETK